MSIIAAIFGVLFGVFRIINSLMAGEWCIALRDLLAGILLGLIFWALYLLL